MVRHKHFFFSARAVKPWPTRLSAPFASVAFYERDDVLFISIHQHYLYPVDTGDQVC